ncbi:MAG: AzlC family ABC transporter permease [Actinomycetia bacterium]|nr:AzlC family ABC transporter permease [Actinomycetes bacterium]
MESQQKSLWLDGVRTISPILVGVIPFGLIFGVTASASDVPMLAAWASSFVVFAGASQLAIVEVLGNGGAAAVAILTAVVINARHMMYSADMGRYAVDEPLSVKMSIAYLLTDQAYLVSSHRFPDPVERTGFTSFYLGGALTLWIAWQISTTAGFVLGTAIPASLSLEFAIPLVFLALLVLAVKDKPGIIAAVVGGAVAVTGVGMPYSLGLLIGALAGVAAGITSERWFA